MKKSEITYQLSTDYSRLYELLLEGKKIIGFYEITDKECCMSLFHYNYSFDFGGFAPSMNFKFKSEFVDFCIEEKLSFIDPEPMKL